MRIPLGIQTTAALAAIFSGAAVCGAAVYRMIFPEWGPQYPFMLAGGFVVFTLGTIALHRLISKDASRELAATNDELTAALEDALAKMKRPYTALPEHMIKTGDDLASVMQEIGHGIANGLSLLQALMADTGGVDGKMAELIDENARLRADNKILDHFGAMMARRPVEAVQEAPRPASRVPWAGAPVDLTDRRGPEEFAPPAVRLASSRRGEVEGLRAIATAIEATGPGGTG